MTGISIHAPARGATGGNGYYLPPNTISIHAPARGATATNSPVEASALISIHAPARGATEKKRKTGQSITYFNPRSREGSDDNAGAATSARGISIHAPARGATNICKFITAALEFQSTLPRGERQQLYPISILSFRGKLPIYPSIAAKLHFFPFQPSFFIPTFVHISWCESPGDFLCACGSHRLVICFRRKL